MVRPLWIAFGRFPGVSGYTAFLLRRFLVGARRVSPVAQHHLVTVLSLPTPPKWLAASVLATLHAAFARKVRARPSGCSTFEAIMGSLALRPGDSLTILEDGFVNRLQDVQLPSLLLLKLRGLGLLARWDSHPLVDSSLHWTHTFRYLKHIMHAG